MPRAFFLAQSDEASGKVEKLQAALADDSAGQEASDRLSEEISQLKVRVASERMRFSHITEALEAAKGSLEEVRPYSGGSLQWDYQYSRIIHRTVESTLPPWTIAAGLRIVRFRLRAL